jgi:ketosteroid isomerase-like protein
MGADGSKVLARYSFVYVKENGEWKIAHHHSSAMPESLLAATAKIKKLEELFMRS